VDVRDNDIPPNANIVVTADMPVCEGDTFTLDGSTSSDLDNDIVLYEWDTTAPVNFTTINHTGAIFTTSFASAGDYDIGLRVTDNDGLNGGSDHTSSAFTSVTVLPADDPSCNQPPVADDQSVSTNEDAAVGITLTGSDPDSDPLTFSPTNPSNGALSGTPPNLTYTPDMDYNGSDSFTFVTNDGSVDSGEATVSITVNPVNDEPGFTANNPPAVDEDAVAQSASVASGFTPGPVTATDEMGQLEASYIVTNVVNGGLLSAGPSVDATGVLTYTPAANAGGTVTFDLQVQDNGGVANGGDDTSATQSVTITINPVNDAPDAVNDSDSTFEDTAVTTSVLTNDNGGPADEDQTLTVVGSTNGANGTVSCSAAACTYTPALNFNGSDSYTYTISDSGGLTDTATVNVTIIPVNDPPVVNTSGSATTGNEGSPIALSVSVTDVDSASLTYAWSVTGPASCSFDNVAVANPQLTCTDNGAHTASVDVSDGEATTTGSVNVTVDNVAPAISGLTLTSATINEDGSATVNGSFTDAGSADTHTVSINWGDGSSSAATVTQGAGNGTFTATHQYLDDNPTATASDIYTVTATVSDDDGGSVSQATSVTVTNVDPVITAVTATIDPQPVGAAVDVSAPFTDVGTNDTHSCTIDWDDGLGPVAAMVDPQNAGSGTCTDARTDLPAGVYGVTVTVTDDDTGSGTESATTLIVVYDPGAGFVTGGGWFNSVAGTDKLNPAAVGKANFGFVAKYKKGAQTPDGQTEFQFKAGDLNFHSTDYQWLVVTGGCMAQYKGTGTINGESGYNFMLTLRDGSLCGSPTDDGFRIKITGAGGLRYDNTGGDDNIGPQSGNVQPIDGGSIKIHRKK